MRWPPLVSLQGLQSPYIHMAHVLREVKWVALRRKACHCLHEWRAVWRESDGVSIGGEMAVYEALVCFHRSFHWVDTWNPSEAERLTMHQVSMAGLEVVT